MKQSRAMKTKSVMQTVGPLGKDHNYLGHFKSEKVLNQGHNDGPRIPSVYGREIDASNRAHDLERELRNTPAPYSGFMESIKEEERGIGGRGRSLPARAVAKFYMGQDKIDEYEATQHVRSLKAQEADALTEEVYRSRKKRGE